MTNEFKPIDRQRIWIDHPYSILSGRNGSDIGDSLALYHITGRSGENKDSIFNSAMLLNQTENIAMHGKLHTEDMTRKLLNKTAEHIFRLVKLGVYELQERDKEFLYEHKQYYD